MDFTVHKPLTKWSGVMLSTVSIWMTHLGPQFNFLGDALR